MQEGIDYVDNFDCEICGECPSEKLVVVLTSENVRKCENCLTQQELLTDTQVIQVLRLLKTTLW